VPLCDRLMELMPRLFGEALDNGQTYIVSAEMSRGTDISLVEVNAYSCGTYCVSVGVTNGLTNH